MNYLVEIKVNNHTEWEVTFPKLLAEFNGIGEKYIFTPIPRPVKSRSNLLR